LSAAVNNTSVEAPKNARKGEKEEGRTFLGGRRQDFREKAGKAEMT